MQIVTTNCPACGGIYGGKFTSRFITCEYCGSRYALTPEELKSIGFKDEDGDGYDDDDFDSREETVDTNNDPMGIYAKRAVEDFLEETANKSSFVSTQKIERGLGLDTASGIYLIHDDTLFKSGKNGFAITSEGFYCREMGDRNAHFVSWSKFAKGKEPKVADSYIRQSGESIVYYTDNETTRNELLDLCRDLWRHARRVM